MNDVTLRQLLVAQVDAWCALDPVLLQLPGIGLVRNYQSRQQGQTSGPSFYFFKVSAKRHGFPGFVNTWVPPVPPEVEGTFEHVQTQVYEDRYQFSALVPQDPAAPNRPTEHDALCALADIMAGDEFRAALKAQGVGILRITEVTNPYFVDDRDRFEASPSFDVVFTYTRQRTTIDPPVSTYDFTIKGV